MYWLFIHFDKYLYSSSLTEERKSYCIFEEINENKDKEFFIIEGENEKEVEEKLKLKFNDDGVEDKCLFNVDYSNYIVSNLDKLPSIGSGDKVWILFAIKEYNSDSENNTLWNNVVLSLMIFANSKEKVIEILVKNPELIKKIAKYYNSYSSESEFEKEKTSRINAVYSYIKEISGNYTDINEIIRRAYNVDYNNILFAEVSNTHTEFLKKYCKKENTCSMNLNENIINEFCRYLRPEDLKYFTVIGEKDAINDNYMKNVVTMIKSSKGERYDFNPSIYNYFYEINSELNSNARIQFLNCILAFEMIDKNTKHGKNIVTINSSIKDKQNKIVRTFKNGKVVGYEETTIMVPYIQGYSEYIFQNNYVDGIIKGEFKIFKNNFLLAEGINKENGNRFIKIYNKEDGSFECGDKYNSDRIGIWKNYNKDKILVSEGYYESNNGSINLDFKKNGLWKFYDNEGRTKIKYYQNLKTFESFRSISEGYINEKEEKHGFWFYIKSINFILGNYCNNKKVGLWIITERMSNNSLEDLWKMCNKDENNYLDIATLHFDEIKEMTNYNSEGLKHGIWKKKDFMSRDEYFININEEGNYVNDKREGLWKIFNWEKEVYLIGNYINNKKEGLWKVIDAEKRKQELILEEGNYINDLREGIWIKREDNKVIKGKYERNRKEGEWVTIENYSFLRNVTNYKRDMIVGWMKIYNSSGKLSEEIEYENNVKKRVREYSKNGKLKEEKMCTEDLWE